ncbi:MAG: FtsX-like permease family protein [Chthonomonadales bacterium]
MTSIHRLSMLNILRRPLRSIVTATGVAVAIAALFSLWSFQRGYQAGLNSELEKLGAHLLLVPKGCPYDAASIALHGASWPCYLDQSYLKTAKSTKHVSAAAPVFMNAVYTPDTGAQNVYCGVDEEILKIKRTWKLDGQFPNKENGLLIGSELAKDRSWKIGQTVRMPGLEGTSGTVSGIIQPTQGPDDLFCYLRLADAQRIFKRPNKLTHILVRLDPPEQLDAVLSDLRGCGAGLEMNIVPLSHLFRTIQNLVESTRLLLGSIALIALFAAGAGVANTFMMAVSERQKEIGILRATGASRSHIFNMMIRETMALCLGGGIAGIVLAIASSGIVETWLRSKLPFAPHDSLIRPEYAVALGCILGAAILGCVSGLLPAWRASNTSPVNAIRSSGVTI